MIKDSDIENVIKNENIPNFSDKSLKDTIEKSKIIYKNSKKNKLISNTEFLLLQVKYINKKLWLSQLIIVFLFSVLLLNDTSENISQVSSIYFSLAIPLLVICAIPEIYRNIQHESFEIESCSYFSLKKVYLSKLLIIGMVDLIFATIIISLTSKATGLPFYQLIIYFLVPFNSTCCICFTSMSNLEKKSSYLNCISIGLIWTVILYSLSKYTYIYEILQNRIWIVLIIMSMFYMAFIIKKFLANTRSYLDVIEFN